MRAVLFLMVGLAISLPSQAATLEQIVQVMALPAQATAAAPGWPNLERLGIKWQHAGLKQSPTGYTRFGDVKFDGLGKTSVYFEGSRSEPKQVTLYLPQDKAIGESQFGVTLRRLLPTAQIKRVRAGCKDEGAMIETAVYQVALTGQRPAYVMLTTAFSNKGLVDTSMDIAAQLSKDWNCPP